jgi:phosphoglycolate phosphatase-like HAD superfamily hydrolase
MLQAGSGGSSATPAGAGAPQPAGSGAPPAAAPVLAACGDTPGPTVATDIHGTITVEDYLDNIGNQTPRPGAAEMLEAYSQRGYFILYITGAPQAIIAETRSWFAEHGFPLERAILTLPEVASLDATVNREYKTMRLQEFLAKGYRVDYGYGDKESDLQAFQAVGVATDHIFSIGAEAGALGTRPIDEGTPVDAAGYEEHLADDVAQLPAVCTPTFTGKDIELVD